MEHAAPIFCAPIPASLVVEAPAALPASLAPLPVRPGAQVEAGLGGSPPLRLRIGAAAFNERTSP